MNKKTIGTIITVLALSSTSCLGSTYDGIRSDNHVDYKRERSNINNIASDSAITAAIKSKILADKKLNGFYIHVETINGKVILRGEVTDRKAIEKAKSIAKNTQGVKSVSSELKVTDIERSKLGNLVSDSAITSAIKTKFLADSKIKSLQIHVDTVNGKVHLKGKVPSEEAADRAISIAHDTHGVKQIESRLEIQDSERSTIRNIIPDSAVTGAIKAKFVADHKIKALDIHVETINGTVYLRGLVPSDEALDRAINIARTTHGAKEVVSYLRIER